MDDVAANCLWQHERRFWQERRFHRELKIQVIWCRGIIQGAEVNLQLMHVYSYVSKIQNFANKLHVGIIQIFLDIIYSKCVHLASMQPQWRQKFNFRLVFELHAISQIPLRL